MISKSRLKLFEKKLTNKNIENLSIQTNQYNGPKRMGEESALIYDILLRGDPFPSLKGPATGSIVNW